jgi:cell wall-associated NlpC family hydrolase
MHDDIPREILGQPWVHGGRGRGFDCIGVVIYTAKRRGIVPPDFDIKGYSRSATADSMMKAVRSFDQYIKPISKQDMQAGDVVLIKNGRTPTHCGVLTFKRGQLHIVHSYIRARMVIEEPLSLWKDRVVHALRFVES